MKLECLIENCVVGRPSTWRTKNIFGNNGQNAGIVNTEGKFWSEQRRFSLKHLKDLGFGRKSLDSVMVREVDFVIDQLLESKDGIVEMRNTFNVGIINIFWQIVADKRFEPGNTETDDMIDTVNSLVSNFTLLAFMPDFVLEMMSTLRLSTTLNKQDDNVNKMIATMKNLIHDHLKDIDHDHPRDFIDIYLTQKNSNPDFSEKQLAIMCIDFFVAGAETTSTTLLFAVLFMTIYPKVQEKCQTEIQEFIGSNAPVINDVHKLPYVMATLMEVQRMAMVAPGSLPHILTRNTVVDGYSFQKGTIFVANLSKFLMDPEVFAEPKSFNPERFIDENGKLKKIEQFVPFGLGKRICMGESLAKNEMFLFFVRMLQRISFEVTNKLPSPNDVIYGLTRMPKPYEVKVKAHY